MTAPGELAPIRRRQRTRERVAREDAGKLEIAIPALPLRQVPAADDRRASRLLRGERCDTESGDDEGGTNYLRRRRQIGHGPILGSLPNVSSTGPSVTVVSVSWIVNVKLLPRMRPRRESGYAP